MTHDSHVPYRTNSQALTIKSFTGNLRRTDSVLSVRVCFVRNCSWMKLSMSSGGEISECRCPPSWWSSSKPYCVFLAGTRVVVIWSSNCRCKSRSYMSSVLNNAWTKWFRVAEWVDFLYLSILTTGAYRKSDGPPQGLARILQRIWLASAFPH